MTVVDEIAGTLGDNIIEVNGVIDFSDFLEYAKEEILEYVREETPHGEYGTDQESLLFKFQGEYYEVTVGNIEWNRYDKQYYFMEQYSPYKISHKVIIPKFPTNGIIDDEWENTGSKVLDGKKILIEDDVFYPQDSLKFSGGYVTIQDVLYIKERLKVKGYAENQFKFDVLV